jgi:hypothetical protein
MKKLVLPSLLILFLAFNSSNLLAQDNSTPAEKKAKIEAWHTAYLTTEMKLTSEESQKFWPIYTAYKAELDLLERPRKSIGKTIDQMTDSELKQLIYKELDNELARANIDRKYVEKFLAILAPIKIVRMKKAEKDFKRMVLEQWRDNHK